MTLTCPECGKDFHVPPSQAHRRWCSWACRRATSTPAGGQPRRFAPRHCEVCGEQLARIRNDRRQRFCSLVCRDRQMTVERPPSVRVTMVCGWCGSDFQKFPSQVAKGRGRFCSKRCAALGRPINGRPSQIADQAIAHFREMSGLAGVQEFRVGRWAIDLALPDQRVAIELDGEYWHGLPEMQAKDRRKDAALAAAGWRVVRVVITKDSTPAEVAQEMASSLSRQREMA